MRTLFPFSDVRASARFNYWASVSDDTSVVASSAFSWQQASPFEHAPSQGASVETVVVLPEHPPQHSDFAATSDFASEQPPQHFDLAATSVVALEHPPQQLDLAATSEVSLEQQLLLAEEQQLLFDVAATSVLLAEQQLQPASGEVVATLFVSVTTGSVFLVVEATMAKTAAKAKVLNKYLFTFYLQNCSSRHKEWTSPLL